MSQRDRFKTHSINALIFLVVFSLFALGWTYALANRTAIIYSDPQIQPVYVCSGGVFQLTRGIEFTRDLNLTISQDLVREDKDGGYVETIGLSSFEKYRKENKIFQSRSIYIPKGTPLGAWTLKTYVTVHEFPLWDIQHQAPDVKIEVIGRCE